MNEFIKNNFDNIGEMFLGNDIFEGKFNGREETSIHFQRVRCKRCGETMVYALSTGAYSVSMGVEGKLLYDHISNHFTPTEK